MDSVVDKGLVEAVARALCEADSKAWRTNEGRSEHAIRELDMDALNNHWRHKARAVIPVVREHCAKVAEQYIEGEGAAAAIRGGRVVSKVYTYRSDAPECPYCGHVHEHDGGFFYDESLTEYECEACATVFDISVYVSTSWTCTRRDPAMTPQTGRAG